MAVYSGSTIHGLTLKPELAVLFLIFAHQGVVLFTPPGVLLEMGAVSGCKVNKRWIQW